MPLMSDKFYNRLVVSFFSTLTGLIALAFLDVYPKTFLFNTEI